MKAISTYYPKETILPNDEAMTLWYDQLKDLDYKATSEALKKWVAVERWSPSIADLRAGAAAEAETAWIERRIAQQRTIRIAWRQERLSEGGSDEN